MTTEPTCEPGVSGPHFFKIATPDREKYCPVSPGRCQNCGWAKDFDNSAGHKTDWKGTTYVDHEERVREDGGDIGYVQQNL